MTTKTKLLMDQFSISQTMAKLMEKHNCQTPDEYRAIRKQRKADMPKKTPKVKAAPVVPQKGGKKK